METVHTMVEAIRLTNQNPRPYLVVYQSRTNSRWFVYAARTLEEADKKAQSLLIGRKIARKVIVCDVRYETTAHHKTIPDKTSE